MDKSRAYVFESSPLKIALNPEVEDLVYTSTGDCFICVSDKAGQLFFEMVHPTVISDGSLLPDLNDNQLKLFWALSRTEINKASNELKNSD